MRKHIETLRNLQYTKDVLKEYSTEWTVIDSAMKSITCLLSENMALRDRLELLMPNKENEVTE